ncbi:MAG: PAS domain S-box protein [Ruminiclostridium sp.]|nr:PAS domain S-box protein [Ruminiclostridium sp.]
MTRRIFRFTCISAFIVLGVLLALFVWEFYSYFTAIHYDDLDDQTRIIAYGVEQNGISFIEGMNTPDINILWLDSNGGVICDTYGDDIDKSEREAFVKAQREGFGEGSKLLPNLTEKNVYSACRLSDGSVILVSERQYTFFAPVMGFVQRVFIFAVIAVPLLFHIARRVSKRIVRPINGIDLDDPKNSHTYEELSPLLDRIEAQQTELKRREIEFRAATDNMREGLVLLNAEGRILTINKAAERILGLDDKDIGSVSLAKSESFSGAIETARSGSISETVMSTGSEDYEVIVSPLMSDGTPVGAVLFMLEMTEREKAEMMRREFTANVSHELKTPLQSISGYAELIMKDMVKPEDIPVFAGRIYSESHRVAALVEDVMKLAKLDEGVIDTQRTEIDLYGVAKSQVQTALQSITNGVRIELAGEPATVNASPSLVGAIMHNLLENAVKYNRENGSVTVNVKDGEKYAELTVSDTGIGIPPEHLGRVFERFYRVDKSRSKQLGGTGLGLAIVKHAASLSNAEVSIDSVPDKGTNVTVRFGKQSAADK